MVPLSVLDLSPITEGSDARQSLRNSADLARHVEALGYKRFWMAEHHSMPGIASAATAVASQTSASPTAPQSLDSIEVGTWAGTVRTAGGEVNLQFIISPDGAVRARVGTRTDSGFARVSPSNADRLTIRFAGDLEAPNPTGMNRETRLYLNRRGAGFGGVITTRPPSSSGLDGSVSYWIEITRRR